MKIADKPGEELVAEFSEVQVTVNIYDDGAFHGRLLELFVPAYMEGYILNEEESAHCYVHFFSIKFEGYAAPEDYKNYIERRFNEFKRELGDLIESDESLTTKLEILENYRIEFEQLKTYYLPEIDIYSIDYKSYLKHKHEKITHSSDKKIFESNLLKDKSEFLSVQLNIIERCLILIKSRIDIVKFVEDTEVKKQGKVVRKTPEETIKKLDIYQSALLFNYLIKAGAILPFDSNNKLAPIISDLTGHSAQILRTECLNQIVDIVKGTQGNIPELLRRKSHNLDRIEAVIAEIQGRIREDRSRYHG
jgi:hypothetical protein